MKNPMALDELSDGDSGLSQEGGAVPDCNRTNPRSAFAEADSDAKLPGGPGGPLAGSPGETLSVSSEPQSPSADALPFSTTALDLTKAYDVALVRRAIRGGWGISPLVGQQLMEQARRALDSFHPDSDRGARCAIRIVQLLALIEARIRVDDLGYTKAMFPELRQRHPSGRRRRHIRNERQHQQLLEQYRARNSEPTGTTEQQSRAIPIRLGDE